MSGAADPTIDAALTLRTLLCKVPEKLQEIAVCYFVDHMSRRRSPRWWACRGERSVTGWSSSARWRSTRQHAGSSRRERARFLCSARGLSVGSDARSSACTMVATVVPSATPQPHISRRACGVRRGATTLTAAPAQLPGDALLAEVTRNRVAGRRRRGPVVAAISALAAVAAVVVMLRPAAREPADTAPSTRSKGGDVGLEVLVRRSDGRGEPVSPDQPLHEGDVIGFRVRPGRTGTWQSCRSTAARRIFEHLPEPNAEPPAIAPGESLLGVAVVLDSVVGQESLFAVVCPERSSAARAATVAAAAVSHAEHPSMVSPPGPAMWASTRGHREGGAEVKAAMVLAALAVGSGVGLGRPGGLSRRGGNRRERRWRT